MANLAGSDVVPLSAKQGNDANGKVNVKAGGIVAPATATTTPITYGVLPYISSS